MNGYKRNVTYTFEAAGKWYTVHPSGDDEVWVARNGAFNAGICFAFEMDGALYASADERDIGERYGYDVDAIEQHLNAYPLPWLQEDA